MFKFIKKILKKRMVKKINKKIDKKNYDKWLSNLSNKELLEELDNSLERFRVKANLGNPSFMKIKKNNNNIGVRAKIVKIPLRPSDISK